MKALMEKEKAYLVHGGDCNVTTRFVAPSLFNYKDDMAAFNASALMDDELFGPLLPIVYYSDFAAVLETIRFKPKPLALYVFSRNEDRIQAALQHTSSGSVVINDCVMQMGNLNLPFGGVGGSGLGTYHGQRSFTTFSHTKAVLRKYFWLDLPQRYMPYTRLSTVIVRAVMTPLPRTLLRRSMALFAMLSLMWLRRPRVLTLVTRLLQVLREA
ncbi:hypothetical protein SDRG_13129 [Saprolegnia diclina VS20]|uniref:Aldehyde dehydrogenase domain-containing protein n=1 Tax=Saprolegnia diclina (strain VS20) TaxID=1156394 RepID=T0RAB1_SAPDV|nr:hypothetical protein SDRG_13129 [Saprolegnia diclina VS20]EQC29098.1 hypothetical protein SDRG_13129 [Saprolegnia diclina VS20]|eukprot:XP_008617433.1 hypothetical protein SDRG_13129 [Saprolegnia diclina VS20]